jgi:hypothetical protein
MLIRKLLVSSMRIRIRILPFSFHFGVDPDLDPSFQIKAQNLEKRSNRLIFHTLWLVIGKLMRIRIQLITLMRIWILPFNLMRIRMRNTDAELYKASYRSGFGETKVDKLNTEGIFEEFFNS